MAKAWEHTEEFLRAASRRIKVVRFVASVVGAALLAASYYLRSLDIQCPDGLSECGPQPMQILAQQAGEVAFWLGIAMVVLANLVLVFVDKQSVETLLDLRAAEEDLVQSQRLRERLEKEREALVAWTTLTHVVSEVLDACLKRTEITDAEARRLLGFCLEAIAERKMRLFGVEEDYLNISLYVWDGSSEALALVACFRSNPSHVKAEHRRWRVGEGHVGKAFELQRELVCSDAREPDVAMWIAAPPDKVKDTDDRRYVSLAAVPVGLKASEPLGVLIMTSDVPGRFSNDAEAESEPPHYGVAALQDIAAQLAQIIFVVQSNGVLAGGAENEGP